MGKYNRLDQIRFLRMINAFLTTYLLNLLLEVCVFLSEWDHMALEVMPATPYIIEWKVQGQLESRLITAIKKSLQLCYQDCNPMNKISGAFF